jgi:flagellar biosynthesis/type III secretory pathway M-ring protein FliF/YscJ
MTVRAGLLTLTTLTTLSTLAEREEFDPNTVTPGVVGFLATFGLALVVVLLAFDMVRRVRRTRYRAEIGAQLDAEEAEARAIARADADGGAGEAGDSPSTDEAGPNDRR